MEQITQNTKITSTDINTLISELNGKLNLSGGTLNGTLTFSKTNTKVWDFSNDNYKGLEIVVGGQHEQTGASLNLYHKDSKTSPGVFFLCAADGTNKKFLLGHPNGSLTWDTKEVATDNITPSAILNMSHPTYQKLCVIKASKDNAPNNGCILSYSNSEKWVGQLFVGDNATQGIYWRGCSDGTWCNWKKIFMEDENGHLYFTNGTQFWIA
jgi:hypothetical protein